MPVLVFIFTCLLAALPGPARAELLVFAAASLKEPLDRIAADYGDVTVSYGGSGTLARQVGLGAPADIVLLANEAWMTALVDGGAVHADTVTDFASNRLVVIGPADSMPLALEAAAMTARLGEGGRIATGLTEAVPAGIYAKAALQSLQLWDELSQRLAQVDNVRAAVALVARRQAPLGIVYATDTRVSDAITTVAAIPTKAHPPIRYMAALTQAGDQAGAAFLAYLTGPEGQAIMSEAGFLPPVAAEAR